MLEWGNITSISPSSEVQGDYDEHRDGVLTVCPTTPVCDRYALESQNRATENMKSRKECEEQYILLQAEHAELHDLLKVSSPCWLV